mgnify:CR=1 FL=1
MIQITQSYGSPFVRKVRIAVAMKGIAGKVEFIDPQSDSKRNEELRASNPLQKIPAARLDANEMDYVALAPDHIADAILHVIDQPWGVSIGDITVRAAGDHYIL